MTVRPGSCRLCPRTLPPGRADAYACAGCEHRMRYTLTSLAAEIPLLELLLLPGRAGSGGGRGAAATHPPLPADLRALDLLGPGTRQQTDDTIPLPALLTGYAHYIAGQFQARYVRGGTEYLTPCTGARPRTGTDLPAWCRWLIAYLPHIVRQPWAPDFQTSLQTALHRVRAITGTQPRTHPRLAPCPACTAFALGRTDGDWEIRCHACGHTMEPDAYTQHAAAVLPALTRTAARIASAQATAAARETPDGYRHDATASMVCIQSGTNNRRNPSCP